MKTSELKYHLKRLSEEIDIDIKIEKVPLEDTLEIRVNRYYFAKINKSSVGNFSVKLESFHSLSERAYVKLLSIIANYSSTPVEEREDDKKYCLVMQEIASGVNVLNLSKSNKSIFIGSRIETPAHKTKFTESEIEKYGLQKFVNNELFELVEVKENE